MSCTRKFSIEASCSIGFDADSPWATRELWRTSPTAHHMAHWPAINARCPGGRGIRALELAKANPRGTIVERVAQLLDSGSENFSHRRALVRLWMLASDDQRLNGWEQNENEKTLAPHRDNFLDQLQQDEVPIGLDAIQAHPLALIRALDDYLASTRPHDSQSASTSRSAYVIEEDGKRYWLVPVQLAARRHAAMNRQPVRLARWFHHHAALPARTAHGVEVTAALSRSALHTALENLANQSDPKLKAWIAHFDDGADVPCICNSETTQSKHQP